MMVCGGELRPRAIQNNTGPDHGRRSVTIYQDLACIKRTGVPFRLRPHEEVLQVQDKGDSITVSLRTCDLVERRTGYEIVRTGVRLIAFTCTDGTWSVKQFTAWDEKPDADFIRTWGTSVTREVQRERDSWAHLAHRVGTGRFPLDSSDRTHLDPNYSTRKMVKHWGVTY